MSYHDWSKWRKLVINKDFIFQKNMEIRIEFSFTFRLEENSRLRHMIIITWTSKSLRNRNIWTKDYEKNCKTRTCFDFIMTICSTHCFQVSRFTWDIPIFRGYKICPCNYCLGRDAKSLAFSWCTNSVKLLFVSYYSLSYFKWSLIQ